MSIATPQPITSVANTTELPIYSTQSEYLTLGENASAPFYQVMVGNSGSLITQLPDGSYMYRPLINAGGVYPITGIKIVAAATVSGQAVTTTATDVWGYRGM